MDDRHGQPDMAHPFAADAFLRHFDAAAVADDPPVPNALILAAVTFPVTHRPEDLLAE